MCLPASGGGRFDGAATLCAILMWSVSADCGFLALRRQMVCFLFFCFFFNDTETTEIYTGEIVGSVRVV